MDKHSPEPWNYEPYSGPAPNFHVSVVTCNDSSSFVVAVAGETKEESLANIRRIVACVNACKGLETKVLEALSGDYIGQLVNGLLQTPVRVEGVFPQATMLEAFLNEGKDGS